MAAVSELERLSNMLAVYLPPAAKQQPALLDDEPLESGANTRCVARPDAWPARAAHHRGEPEAEPVLTSRGGIGRGAIPGEPQAQSGMSGTNQEKVPGSLLVGEGLITVSPSIMPSQQGAAPPHGSQPQGAAWQGSQGVPQPLGVPQPRR